MRRLPDFTFKESFTKFERDCCSIVRVLRCKKRWSGAVIKKLTGICLVAGTSIGAGVLALPMTLVGFSVHAVFWMLVGAWVVAYYTALVSMELNLQYGRGCTLRFLISQYSKVGGVVANVLFKTLCYALLSAYVCSCADMIQVSLRALDINVPFFCVNALLCLAVAALFFIPFSFLGWWNKMLFGGVVVGLCVLVSLLLKSSFSLTGGPSTVVALRKFIFVTPVLFTSFGFQVLFHSLMDFFKGDSKTLKSVFFWGTLVPLAFYFLWTKGSLEVICAFQESFAASLEQGGVTSLLQGLSRVSFGMSNGFASFLFWAVGWLAVLTSLIGVGIGLIDSWEEDAFCLLAFKSRRLLGVSVAVLPVFLIVSLCPDFFIHFLSFAGVVLAMIAIFMPLLVLRLYMKAKPGAKRYYPLVYRGSLQLATFLYGAVVVLGDVVSKLSGVFMCGLMLQICGGVVC